ncbi:MAG: tetratricopeptide repeat protein [Planctomycetes bacterium]|nr:tetratricopeptide repeat protein [Planctomycetota bacterium]
MFNPVFLPFWYVARAGEARPMQDQIFPALLAYKFDFVPDNYNSRHPLFIFPREKVLGAPWRWPTAWEISAYVRRWMATVAIGGRLVQDGDQYGGAMSVYDDGGQEILHKEYEIRYGYFALMGQMVRDWMAYRGQPCSEGLAQELDHLMCSSPKAVDMLADILKVPDRGPAHWAIYERILEMAPEFGEVRFWYANQRGWVDGKNAWSNENKGLALMDHIVIGSLWEFEMASCMDPNAGAAYQRAVQRMREIAPDNVRLLYSDLRNFKPSETMLPEFDGYLPAAARYPCFYPFLNQLAYEYRKRHIIEKSLPLHLSATRSGFLPGAGGFEFDWMGMAYGFAQIGNLSHARWCANAGLNDHGGGDARQLLLEILAICLREHGYFWEARSTWRELWKSFGDTAAAAQFILTSYEGGRPDPFFEKGFEKALRETCWWPLIEARRAIAGGDFTRALAIPPADLDLANQRRAKDLWEKTNLFDLRLETCLVRADAALLAGNSSLAQAEAGKACRVSPWSLRAVRLLLQAERENPAAQTEFLEVSDFMHRDRDPVEEYARASEAAHRRPAETSARELIESAAQLRGDKWIRFWHSRRPWSVEFQALSLARWKNLDLAMNLYTSYADAVQELSDSQDVYTRVFLRKLLRLAREDERKRWLLKLDARPSGPSWYFREQGRSLFLQRRYPEALDLFHKARRSAKSDDPSIFYWLGYACHQLGEDTRAIEYLERSIEIDPQSAWSHHYLGASLCRTGHHLQALEAFLQCAEKDGHRMVNCLHEDVAHVWKELAARNPSEEDIRRAAGLVENILQSGVPNADYWRVLGECSQRLGENEKAEQCFSKAEEMKRLALPFSRPGPPGPDDHRWRR